MNLPFTVDEFLALFESYNRAIWPAQAMGYALGVLATGLALWRSRAGDRIVVAVLALMWLWTGVVYHIFFFSEINRAAFAFGAAFVLQSVLLAVYGVFQNELRFRVRPSSYGVIGGFFILYAMLIYPLIGLRLGHVYPQSPMFGVSPCPVTIFTFGLLLWAEPPVPRMVMFLPFVWSVIGFVAALHLGILEDIGLLAAGVAGSLMIIHHERSLTKARLEAVKGQR
ncbi:hypothetical protein KKH27_06165 [bacterium]|nr:hypothetical protein [bacterium]MBU1984983.1 hypothetical protein [bacterium]